jgi:hypothetical protein
MCFDRLVSCVTHALCRRTYIEFPTVWHTATSPRRKMLGLFSVGSKGRRSFSADAPQNPATGSAVRRRVEVVVIPEEYLAHSVCIGFDSRQRFMRAGMPCGPNFEYALGEASHKSLDYGRSDNDGCSPQITSPSDGSITSLSLKMSQCNQAVAYPYWQGGRRDFAFLVDTLPECCRTVWQAPRSLAMALFFRLKDALSRPRAEATTAN